MGLLGGLLGHSLGRGIAHAFHLPKNVGGLVGGTLGTTLEPFQTGGYVKGKKGTKKGQAVPILAHAGEFVVPLNSKPTKKQKKQLLRIRKKPFSNK